MKKTLAMFLLFAALAPMGMRPACADDVTSAQLSAIQKKQDQILIALEELKNELQIVKIRITSSR